MASKALEGWPMPVTLCPAELAAQLNPALAPHGFALSERPEGSGRLLLTHPGIDEVLQARAFLNHGLHGAVDSGVTLMLTRKQELAADCGFKRILLVREFDPELVAQALLQAGGEVLAAGREFLDEANLLHRRLLEHREAITQAGFYLEPTFFLTNLENYRELRRITPERIDLVGVTLDDQGQLVANKLKCAFHQPIPFGTALKVMGLGLSRS